VFVHIKKLFMANMSIRLKNRIIKSVSWNVVLYTAESWTVTEADRKRLQAMEMWIRRRMEKISWVDKISNEEFIQRVNETRTMLDTVRKCKRVVRTCAKNHCCMI